MVEIYYSEELRRDVIQLGDEHILWKIENPELTEIAWMNICEREAEKFKAKFHTDLYYCGRMGRHVCVDNTASNRRRYDRMQSYVDTRVKELVEEINGKGI